MPKSQKRTFTVSGSDNGHQGGHYVGSSPTVAGRKAATQLFKKGHKGNTLQFLLRETTQGSAKKVFSYRATQRVLHPPLKVMIAGKEVTITKKLELKAEKVRS